MYCRSVGGAMAAGILCLSFWGCGPRVVVVRGGPAPAWVDKLPQRSGSLCALGYSGTTFYQQDCVKNAAENARGHLAECISVTIRTMTIDISDGTRGSFSRDVFVQGSESASEAVLQGSEVEAQWVDMQGQRGAPGGCYALVCIDPNKPIDKLVEKLEENKVDQKTVDRVRANAEAAFEELEKAEQKAQEKAAPPPPHIPEAGPGDVEQPAEDRESPEPPVDEEADDTTKAVRKFEIPLE